MSENVTKANETRYQKKFGWFAGYLPRNMEFVDEWQRTLKEEIAQARLKAAKRQVNPAVEQLAKLIETNGIVRMYVEGMIEIRPHSWLNCFISRYSAQSAAIMSAAKGNPGALSFSLCCRISRMV